MKRFIIILISVVILTSAGWGYFVKENNIKKVCDALLNLDSGSQSEIPLNLPVSCKTIVGPDNNQITFDFLKNGDFRISGDTNVTYDAQLVVLGEETLLNPEAFVFKDLNFDGYKDVTLLVRQGEYNNVYTYLVYNPGEKAYRVMLENISNPLFDIEDRTLVAHETLALGKDMVYEEKKYQFVDEKYVLVSSLFQDVLDYSDPETDFIRITKELQNGVLVEVKKETLSFDQVIKTEVLPANKNLYCRPDNSFLNDYYVLKFKNDSLVKVLYKLSNPEKSWYRVTYDNRRAFSEEQVKGCAGYADDLLTFWAKEDAIRESARAATSTVDYQIYARETLGKDSFFNDLDIVTGLVRVCPDKTCDIQWIGGTPRCAVGAVNTCGISTVIDKKDEWYRVVVSNIDTKEFSALGGDGWLHRDHVPTSVKEYYEKTK